MKNILRRLFHRIDHDAELREEMQFHVQMRAELNRESGMPGDDALSAARRQFGNRELIREEVRRVYVHPFVETIGQDIRYALRTLARSPGFTAVAVLTLALGIGANIAVFQILDTIVLRSLPVRDPHQLVRVQGYHGDMANGFSYPLLREMMNRQTTVDGIFASAPLDVRELWLGASLVEEPGAAWVATGDYFRLIGADPQHGRFFTEADDDPNEPLVAVISDSFWRAKLGGRPDALGQQIRINGLAATIVGVTRPGFVGERVGAPSGVWLPMSFIGRLYSPSSLTASSIWLEPMARLRKDIPLARAQAELSLLWDQLRDLSMRFRGVTQYRLELLPASQGLGVLHTRFSRSLWTLMAIVALLALLASCNLANLLLARATGRTREVAVRLAIGAGRRRLVRQLLTESVVLSLIAAGLGLALAAVSSRGLVSLAAAGETWNIPTNVDWRVVGFTAFVSLASTFIFGLAPALTATRFGLNAALQGYSRTHTTSPSRNRAAKLFIGAQVAISFVLAAGALLLGRSFWTLTHQDFGFQPENVVYAELEGDGKNFRDLLDTDLRQAIYHRLNEIPGIASAAVMGSGIMGQWSPISAAPIALPDRLLPGSLGFRIVPVSPRYLETMRIPVLRGRTITDDDRRNSNRIAVISETAARLMFGSDDPIGRIFAWGNEFPSQTMFEVAGVMKDHRFGSPREPFSPLVFAPLLQMSASGPPRLVFRTSGDGMQFAKPLEDALRETAPTLRIVKLSALTDVVQTAARQERLLAWLSGAFGGLGLLLTSFGLYGVVAYTSQQRTQEIGIRLALGAHSGQIRRRFLAESLRPALVGMFGGIAGTIIVTRYLRSILFDITPNDPATIVITAAVILIVAALAAYLPARRASRIDPLAALRYE
jgi:predicted permease